MTGNILVISDSGLTQGLRSQFERYVRKAGLSMANVRITTNLTQGLQVKRTKTKMMAEPQRKDEFAARLTAAIHKYQASCLIINDWVALEYITGKHQSLDLTRGSVYFVNGLPAIVVDSLRLQGRGTGRGGSKLAVVNHAGWLLLQDLKKVKRWHEGEQKHEPAFNYRLVRTSEDIEAFERDAESAVCIAMDLETTGAGKGSLISCSGYAMLQPDGRVLSWVVPLLDPTAAEGTHWDAATFGKLLSRLRRVHASGTPKIMQNGSYDTHYYVRYRMPLRHWILDTAVAFHSIWPEIPKRIDFICSIAVDHYRFWKDEGKADKKDDEKADALPTTANGWEKYLRYCALDCHYTLLAGMFCARIISEVDWVRTNYRESMRQTLGPAAAMSLRGVRVSQSLQAAFAQLNEQRAFEHEQRLFTMVNDTEFNPNSTVQVASLIYDVLQGKPLPKYGRSTDEKTLNIVMTQHPLIDRVVREIWAVKKPRNNMSKYGPLRMSGDRRWNGLGLWNGRWLYKMNAIGTETGRYSSKASDFWIGTQVQNIPYEMRAVVEPDPGYILFDFDYSKADFWHTAFASREPEMMRVALQTDLDVHCYHASKFFSKPYEAIYTGYRAKEHWVVDSLRGVRQNAKRIVYGANYLMAGMTLFLQMGKEAVDATAAAMGKDTAHWRIDQYVKFCQSLLDFYFDVMYPNLLNWLEEQTRRVTNNGNRAVCAGGRTRTFFANLMSDKAGQRELASYYGQGGTASTMNRVMDHIYYSGIDSQDLMLLFQVHDSICGQVREDKLHLLRDLHAAMEIENEMHGQRFVIPVEGDVGYGWGFRMCGWHPDITIDEIREADEKWRAKNSELMNLAA